MSTKDYVSEDEAQANLIGPLDYGRLPRQVVEMIYVGKLKMTDIKVFCYILLNENVHYSRSHAIDAKRVASFTGMHVSSVYRSLGKLVKLGILKPRKSRLVFDLPIQAASRQKTRRQASENHEKRIQADVASKVKEMQEFGVRVTRTVRSSIEKRIRQKYAESG